MYHFRRDSSVLVSIRRLFSKISTKRRKIVQDFGAENRPENGAVSSSARNSAWSGSTRNSTRHGRCPLHSNNNMFMAGRYSNIEFQQQRAGLNAAYCQHGDFTMHESSNLWHPTTLLIKTRISRHISMKQSRIPIPKSDSKTMKIQTFCGGRPHNYQYT